MANKYRKKPVIIEAITFDELVEYGRSHAANLVNGVPYAFDYNGYAVTHEHDDCYLICILAGTLKLWKGDMLITEANGEMSSCKDDIFEMTYEKLDGGTL